MKPTTPATQTNLFPTGNDLPLFSLTPVRGEVKPYHPAPVAKQARMYTCPVCKDTRNFAGKPCPTCR